MINLHIQQPFEPLVLVTGLKFISFPGGERHVRLPELSQCLLPGGHWVIEARIETPADVMDLLLVNDALRRARPGDAVALVMPYVPYARQDRVALAGEPLSAEVFCGLINNMKFLHVTIMDPHSQVVVDLLDNVVVTSPRTLLPKTLKAQGAIHLMNCAVLVSPDKGARSRVLDVADGVSTYRGSPVPVIQALKQRDPVTGTLSAPQLLDSVPTGVPLLVVDDICDGGGTFIQLAELLRQHTNALLYLYVTHGIFSKGVDVLAGSYAKVFCPYPFSKSAEHFEPLDSLV